ncbi:hypothetical protein DC366_16485 [Pelagivirga sediminicola]|uniref:Uncharacterized protein n=2 Tax=Pelagivirga sediminicola TaxID=2170575 RepID=A0A2T7G3B2_9RHOB|nr:hypothetical protein DC366_16485 [Pelagivirga sediminicola]
MPGPAAAALLLLAAAAAMIVAVLTLDPVALARGALAGWLFCLSVCTGASVWLLIGALTGGRWLVRAAPVLGVLARGTWAVALLGVALVPLAPLLFPWWEGETDPALWFDVPFFALRGAAVLILWSVLGFVAMRPLPPVLAALALTLYALAVSVASADWVLSLDPGFVSTAFGAHLAVLQLALALAAVAVLSGGDGDIGGLLLVCVLGVFYLAAMEYVVSWTGNLPHKAAWYLARQDGWGPGWLWLSFIVGIAGPFAALLSSRIRKSAAALRVIGGAMLVGGLAHLVWLLAPECGAVGMVAIATVAAALSLALLIAGGRHER